MNAAPENKPPAGKASGTAPETAKGHTQMSAHDFANWGVAHVAYVKPLEIEGRTLWGVFAANGQQVALMDNPATARASLIQNDLEPVSVH